jgi:hypothetical protein
MTGATPKYGDARDSFPMIEAGQALSAAQIQLIATALSRRAVAGRAVADEPTLKEQFACDGVACICNGLDDCGDMFGSGSCGDAMCFSDGSGGVVCICVQV